MPTAQRTTDRRRARGEASRQAIIEAAIACIAGRGLRNTTLDAVAARAKVSRALVLFHFKSKNRLHIEVLNYLGSQFSTGWDAILAREGASASETLLNLLEFDARFVSEFPEYVSVWHAFWGEAKGSTLYREVSSPRDRRYMKDVRTLLQALAEEDDCDNIDLTALIMGMEAMLFGFWLNAHLNPLPDQIDDRMRALRTYLSALFPRHFAAE